MSAALDPYSTRPGVTARHFLHALNPLAKIAGPLPFMVYLLFVRDIATPLAFACLALLLVTVGARLTPRLGIALWLGLPLVVGVLSLSFGLWTDASRVDHTPLLFQLGDYRFFLGAWLIGLATALRLGALLSLALIAGLTMTGPDLVRALVQHLHVPYRIGYTALAAYRFVPRFRHELDGIRHAHRVRGIAGGRGPLAALRRYLGYIVPLLVGAIRHAERVALAMDSRAFGAFETRTERYLVPLRARDWIFAAAFWVIGASVIVGTARLG
ncbi:energy-coupling factor transport system permease protein [Okibacterium sp. HSC-33S16]|uniref:energy-coupling factor transporter transmembrane component T n=1 Tax=Okibacterium sp. HSC-33S16 TaxID=2910965 RepID=UPI0020A0190C|nr:energy-coupling factor transporter transmembrane component T [Okibacterium sp. HSC-33S16]MCP2031520.1 energy-coupling factor transport system permease protein [Okibacterium sp. HSC-33S16]